MKKFTIKDLENFSGIRAHTIRIWEKRYGILQPFRSTVSNFRSYTLDQLKNVLDIALLNRNGYKISHLAGMDAAEINRKVSELVTDADQKERAINKLIIYMHQLDPEAFEMVLDNCLLSWSVDTLVKEIIFTFLKRMGLLWQGNRLTEEHFIVTSVRRKLMLGIEKADAMVHKKKAVLLFLPEARQLDLGLLYTSYVLKCSGSQVLYMGVDVSLSNLKTVFAIKQIDFIFTYLPKKHRFPLSELATHMYELLPQSKLVVVTYPESIPIENNHPNLLNMSFENALSFLEDEQESSASL